MISLSTNRKAHHTRGAELQLVCLGPSLANLLECGRRRPTLAPPRAATSTSKPASDHRPRAAASCIVTVFGARPLSSFLLRGLPESPTCPLGSCNPSPSRGDHCALGYRRGWTLPFCGVRVQSLSRDVFSREELSRQRLPVRVAGELLFGP